MAHIRLSNSLLALAFVGALAAPELAVADVQGIFKIGYDFGGDEIYFKEEPALVGKPFSASLLSYEDSTILGLVTPSGAVELCPPDERTIAPGDKLIAISADDDHCPCTHWP